MARLMKEAIEVPYDSKIRNNKKIKKQKILYAEWLKDKKATINPKNNVFNMQ